MARLSDPFRSMPRNRNARRRIFRNARLGVETVRSYSAVDAMATIGAAAAVVDAVRTSTIPFIEAVEEAWGDRKDWRP